MITIWKCVQIECDKSIAKECIFRDDVYEAHTMNWFSPHKNLIKRHMKKHNLYLRSHDRVVCEFCKNEIIKKFKNRKLILGD